MNGYQGQIRARDQENGKFLAGQQLFNLIKDNSSFEIDHLQRIGIFAPEDTVFLINGKQIKIGKTKIYEADEVIITSLQVMEDSSNEVIIDFVVSV